MHKNKIIDIKKALDLIKDNDTIATSGFVGFGHAEYITKSLEKSIKKLLNQKI